MRSRIVAAFAFALAMTPLPLHADLLVPSQRVVTRVVIRAAPDRSSEDIGSFAPGDKTNLHGEVPYWYKIRLADGRYGYVSKSWTQRVPGTGPLDVSTLSGPGADSCGGEPMTVRFFDAGQALSALVQLPDGRTVLVDTGEAPNRPSCGAPCATWSKRVLDGLESTVGSDNTISMLWITHQHSDHHGNAIAVLENYDVEAIVTNGTKPTKPDTVNRIQAKAKDRGTKRITVDPTHLTLPVSDTSEVQFRAIVPTSWPTNCAKHPNDCSIALRIDYCASSLLFTGDAEDIEERVLDPGDINLLQVGHHGSETSSTEDFLSKVQPEYAVISCAKKDEGTNKGYCHPRVATLNALSVHLNDKLGPKVKAFDSQDGDLSCKDGEASDWKLLDASQNLFVTARDGDVVLQTNGDGTFERVQ